MQLKQIFVLFLVFALIAPRPSVANPPVSGNTGGSSPSVPSGGNSGGSPQVPQQAPNPNPAPAASGGGADKQTCWRTLYWVVGWTTAAILSGLVGYYVQDNMNNVRGKADFEKKHEDAILQTEDNSKKTLDLLAKIAEGKKLGDTSPAGGTSATVTETQVNDAVKAVAAARDHKTKQPLPELVRNKATTVLKDIGESPDTTYGKQLIEDAQKELLRLAGQPEAAKTDGEAWVLVKMAEWLEDKVKAEKKRRADEAEAKRIEDLFRGSSGRKKN